MNEDLINEKRYWGRIMSYHKNLVEKGLSAEEVYLAIEKEYKGKCEE